MAAGAPDPLDPPDLPDPLDQAPDPTHLTLPAYQTLQGLGRAIGAFALH